MGTIHNIRKGSCSGDTQSSVIDAARVITCEGIAGEAISALQVVRLIDETTFMLSNNSTYTTAASIGISLNTASIGGTINVQLFGRHEDPFWAFSLNEPLFLSDITAGLLTETDPTTDHLVRIGQSLGPGAIFIDIEDPVIL